MSTFHALANAELDAIFEETATGATRTAIELARQIHSGTRGELGHDRAEDALTIASFASAIVKLAELVSVERAR